MSDQTSSKSIDHTTHRAAGDSTPPGFRRYDRYASILQAGTLTKPPGQTPQEQRIAALMIEHAASRQVRLLVLLVETDGVQIAAAAKALGMTALLAREHLASLRRIALRGDGQSDAQLVARQLEQCPGPRRGKRVMTKGQARASYAETGGNRRPKS